MAVQTSAWLVGVVLIAVSIYIGLEIDFRDWTWILFLLVGPIGIAALLVGFARRRGRTTKRAAKARAR